MKSRNITINEYINQLYNELFSAELREKIYVDESDKKYWSTIAFHKKIKIDSICECNLMKNDTETKRKYFFENVNASNFCYRDLHQERKLYKKDIYYFLKIKSEVFIKNEIIEKGIIVSYNLESNEIEIFAQLENKKIKTKIENICRKLN